MDTAVAWYERLLGQPPTARPMPILADWKIEGGHRQVVHDSRAGASLLTLDISHLDDVAAEVAATGLVAQTLTITQGDTVRFAQIADPDGNSITLVESPSERFDDVGPHGGHGDKPSAGAPVRVATDEPEHPVLRRGVVGNRDRRPVLSRAAHRLLERGHSLEQLGAVPASRVSSWPVARARSHVCMNTSAV